MNYITSRNNERIKSVARLKNTKDRCETGLFFIEGIHLAEEYLRLVGIPKEIYFTEKALSAYSDFIRPLPDDIKYQVADNVFEKISTESAPQGILCVCEQLSFQKALAKGGCLFLESLRDTGNLGTVIRTAVSLGIKSIVLSEDCADIYNPKTLRASMGAVFAANLIFTEDFHVSMEKAKAFGKVYATALHEDSLVLGNFKIFPEDSFVIGNEGKGVSEKTKECCDATVFIPMSGKTESLNASAAASIIIWEMTRS